MIALEVLGIVAIACSVWVFGGTFLDRPVSLISGLAVVVLVVTVVLSVAYVSYVRRHSTVASERMLPIFLRLLLSLCGLPCMYFLGKLIVYFTYYSESDITSGKAEEEYLTYAVGTLFLLILAVYARRIFHIMQQRRHRA